MRTKDKLNANQSPDKTSLVYVPDEMRFDVRRLGEMSDRNKNL